MDVTLIIVKKGEEDSSLRNWTPITSAVSFLWIKRKMVQLRFWILLSNAAEKDWTPVCFGKTQHLTDILTSPPATQALWNGAQCLALRKRQKRSVLIKESLKFMKRETFNRDGGIQVDFCPHTRLLPSLPPLSLMLFLFSSFAAGCCPGTFRVMTLGSADALRARLWRVITRTELKSARTILSLSLSLFFLLTTDEFVRKLAFYLYNSRIKTLKENQNFLSWQFLKKKNQLQPTGVIYRNE